MPTEPGKDTLGVRVGVLERTTDRHELMLAELQKASADTRATVDSVSDRLTGIESALRDSETRVTSAVSDSEKRLEKRLDEQDANAKQIHEAASAALEAAGDAQAISRSAYDAARREWPTVAKVAVTIMTGVAIGLIVFAITHFAGG